MSRLWAYLRRYRVRYLGGILCLVGATTLSMTIPWLYKEAIDAITAGAGARTLAGYLGLVVAIAWWAAWCGRSPASSSSTSAATSSTTSGTISSPTSRPCRSPSTSNATPVT